MAWCIRPVKFARRLLVRAADDLLVRQRHVTPWVTEAGGNAFINIAAISGLEGWPPLAGEADANWAVAIGV